MGALAHGGGIAAREGATTNSRATGRFEFTGQLTSRQRTFVDDYVQNGGHGAQAARVAGYSNPKSDAWRLLDQPHVQDAIRKQTARLLTEGTTRGLSFLVRAVDDPALAGSVRVRAAMWLAEAGGHGLAARRAALGLPDHDKEPHEMDARELQAFLKACAAARLALEQQRERMTIAGEFEAVAPDETLNGAGGEG